MRLVKLEIKGFKSFARDTVLHFGEDVIGVVGPNGSGKSNIVDAIRWVLGEQKKGELRLDKMSSVIFNGTKKRKPGNVAQVFLTFNNDKGILKSEFQTITIGRLLYRSGDSEYRLNGVPCRRRDITDLFVDTGIESNSYAIIALGMVDDILADKDNSRLRMLEQAAGISVYKTRKKETLRRLERTQEDLDRVEDLLFEIDNNLKALDKQAKRTRKYFQIKETYKEASLDYAYSNGAELRKQVETISEKLAQAERYAVEQDSTLARLEVRIEDGRSQQTNLELQLNQQRQQLGTVVGKLRSARNKLQLAEQKVSYLAQNQDKLTAQRERNRQELERLKTASTRFEERLVEATRNSAEQEAIFNREREQLSLAQQRVASTRDDAKKQSSALRNAERALMENDRQQTRLQGSVEARQREATRRARLLESAQTKLVEAESTHLEAKKRLEAAKSQLANAEDLESRRQVREQELRDKIDEVAPQLRTARSKLQRVENERSLLQAMLNRMEGSPASVKYLAKQHGWRRDYEQLSDILTIEPAYRSAVEAVLSPFLNSFLVPDRATAAEGLRLLAEGKQAVTTILIYEGIQPAIAAESPTNAKSARSVVKVPHRYEALVSYLLENVWITTESPALIARDTDAKIVDIDGRQVWSPHSAQGGTRSKLQGKQTGRKQRLVELDEEIEKLSATIESVDAERVRLEAELTAAKSGASQRELRELRQRVTGIERKAINAEAQVETLRQQATVAGGQDAEDQGAIQKLTDELKSLAQARVLLKNTYEQAELEEAKSLEQTEVLAEELASLRSAYNEANVQTIRLRNTVESLTRERDYADQQFKQLSQTQAEIEEALGTDHSELEQLRAAIEELKDSIAQGTETRQQQQTALEAEEQIYYQQRQEIVKLEKDLRQLQRDRNELSVTVTRMQEQRTENKHQLQRLRDRLEIEFGLDFEEATTTERQVTQSLAELESQLTKLKKRLDNYGEINPLAVEAYEAMSERHESITTQRDDILKAKNILVETIEEIDRSATERLLEAFEAVRGHFTEVFRHLFDEEDTADMIMLDPENPLESKIEIVAKPKGKRPQTISQLSGGEKTLTATAFLFALYLIKPAPFCIFDEVDAPLDDTNVEKFNRIIKRFSGDSQFIIVTHNKLTMAAVDTIYGVYMPELGVSSVTPVDFRDFEHTTSVQEMVG